jgi:WD40 repeat protein
LAVAILRLWDPTTGKPIGKPMHHDDIIYAVAFSPNSKIIVSSSRDKTIRLWNSSTGEIIGEPLTDDKNELTSLAFSPDGNSIVSSSGNNTLRVWDITWANSLDSLLQANCKLLQNHSIIMKPIKAINKDAKRGCEKYWR